MQVGYVKCKCGRCKLATFDAKRCELSSVASLSHVEIARTCSKLVTDRFEAQFHYAILSQTGPKLVAHLSQTY